MKKTLIGAFIGIVLSAFVFGILCIANIVTFKNNNNGNNNSSAHITTINNVSDLLTPEDITKNFKDLTKTENDWNLTFSCNSYNEEEKRCENSSVIIDDIIKTNTDLVTCGTTKIIKNDKYYVLEEGTNCGIDKFSFIIYSKEGKKLYEEQKGTSYLNRSYIEDNIYYYNTYEDAGDNNDKLFYKSVNLNANEITSKTIKSKLIDKLPETE